MFQKGKGTGKGREESFTIDVKCKDHSQPRVSKGVFRLKCMHCPCTVGPWYCGTCIISKDRHTYIKSKPMVARKDRINEGERLSRGCEQGCEGLPRPARGKSLPAEEHSDKSTPKANRMHFGGFMVPRILHIQRKRVIHK